MQEKNRPVIPIRVFSDKARPKLGKKQSFLESVKNNFGETHTLPIFVQRALINTLHTYRGRHPELSPCTRGSISSIGDALHSSA